MNYIGPFNDERKDMPVTDEMVSRFLGWKLPSDFCPDAGISFKAEFNESTPYPMRHEPTGTNLLTYDQARAMLVHVLAEPTSAPHIKTAAEMRMDAAHDTSCVGAFARARP